MNPRPRPGRQVLMFGVWTKTQARNSVSRASLSAGAHGGLTPRARQRVCLFWPEGDARLAPGTRGPSWAVLFSPVCLGDAGDEGDAQDRLWVSAPAAAWAGGAVGTWPPGRRLCKDATGVP